MTLKKTINAIISKTADDFLIKFSLYVDCIFIIVHKKYQYKATDRFCKNDKNNFFFFFFDEKKKSYHICTYLS